MFCIRHRQQHARELQVCANLLETQLLKIGGMLSTRWVVFSFRSVSAVWESFQALVDHFQTASQDVKHRDVQDKSMQERHRKTNNIGRIYTRFCTDLRFSSRTV